MSTEPAPEPLGRWRWSQGGMVRDEAGEFVRRPAIATPSSVTPDLRAALIELHEAAKAHVCTVPDEGTYPINECGPDCWVEKLLASVTPSEPTLDAGESRS